MHTGGLSLSWDIPFDPAEYGVTPVFVWCPTKDAAEELVETYSGDYPRQQRWIERWNSYGEETIYAIPRGCNNIDRWLYGSRDSLDAHWQGKGYVPRIYDSFAAKVSVEDLI